MISIKDNEITFMGKRYQILEWRVWFITPFGLYQGRQDAIDRVIKSNMDPELVIVPVAVALGPDGIYEVKP